MLIFRNEKVNIGIKKSLNKKHSNIDLKIRKYCVQQERCEKQVRYKLLSESLTENEVELICIKLKEGKYFNDERYARIKAMNYLHQKKWGVGKIILFLKSMEISEVIINSVMSEINPAMEEEQLRELVQKHISINTDPWKLFQKCLRNGFEEELVKKVFLELLDLRY